MSVKAEIKLINQELSFVKEIFIKTVNLIPSFNITDSKILPYGLRPHTRSISWIAEQIIVQQAKFNAKKIGIDKVFDNISQNYLHNIVIEKNKKKHYVKVKVHLGNGKNYQNTIASTAKLFMQYDTNLSYNLIYATVGINSQNQIVRFNEKAINVFSPQFLPISINPKTGKVIGFFQHTPIYRNRKTFLDLLAEESTAIISN